VVLTRPGAGPCMAFLFVSSRVLPPASFGRRLLYRACRVAHLSSARSEGGRTEARGYALALGSRFVHTDLP
jgi:hypothetical protein